MFDEEDIPRALVHLESFAIPNQKTETGLKFSVKKEEIFDMWAQVYESKPKLALSVGRSRIGRLRKPNWSRVREEWR